MFTIRTATTSSSTCGAGIALHTAITASEEGRQPTIHKLGGRILSLEDLSAIVTVRHRRHQRVTYVSLRAGKRGLPTSGLDLVNCKRMAFVQIN